MNELKAMRRALFGDMKRGRRADLERPLLAGDPLGGHLVQGHVDGVSLSINDLPRRGIIQVSLIPHTLAVTTLGTLGEGDRVHVEADLIGKYVEAFLRQGAREPGS